jgi:hypothetical protein
MFKLHSLNIDNPNDVDIEKFTAALNELYQQLGDRICNLFHHLHVKLCSTEEATWFPQE